MKTLGGHMEHSMAECSAYGVRGLSPCFAFAMRAQETQHGSRNFTNQPFPAHC